MRKHKISIDKVQEAFNAAIKRRDGRCMIKDFEPCYGPLECSHFYTVGSSPALRFYPLNAWTQCSKHHFNHHNKKEPFYQKWLVAQNIEHYEVLIRMERWKNKYIKYTDDLKAEIIRLCNADKLDELKELIEEKLQ